MIKNPKPLASSTLFIFITKSYHFLEIFLHFLCICLKMATELVSNKIHEHEIILQRILKDKNPRKVPGCWCVKNTFSGMIKK